MIVLEDDKDYDAQLENLRDHFLANYREVFKRIKKANKHAIDGKVYEKTMKELGDAQRLLYDKPPFNGAHRDNLLLTFATKYNEDASGYKEAIGEYRSVRVRMFLLDHLPGHLANWADEIGDRKSDLIHPDLWGWSAENFIRHLAQQLAFEAVRRELRAELLPSKSSTEAPGKYTIAQCISAVLSLIESRHDWKLMDEDLKRLKQKPLAELVSKLSGHSAEAVRQVVHEVLNNKFEASHGSFDSVKKDVSNVKIDHPAFRIIGSFYENAVLARRNTANEDE